MVYVKSGTYQMGNSDQDMRGNLNQRNKVISVSGFYMDDTEITNNEYRQFVYWVRDSMAHAALEHFSENEDGTQTIDWSQPLEYGTEENSEQLSNLYYSKEEQLSANELDPKKIIFSYKTLDRRGIAKDKGKNSRKEFLTTHSAQVLPDDNCWINDFAYSYNEPMAQNYFNHPAYDEYPAVGVNWQQAKAFCAWRSQLWNSYQGNGSTWGEEFRLPSEAQWEYAARGGRANAPFGWGGPYLRNRKGCLLANFKPGRGNYPEDGGQYTVKVGSYQANDYGLYDMHGNVAEWTDDAYFDNAGSFTHDMNPYISYNAKEDDPDALRRKVVRGGSWKDIGYFLQSGTRDYEFSDNAKSYIGFRSILPFQGRSMSDYQ